jgi:hypothetical protein
MATETSPRRFSWTGLIIAVLGASALGVAIPYGLAAFAPDKPAAAAAAPPRAPAVPPAPPKVDFLGPAKVAGTTASLADPAKTAELGVDDAMIVWLKVDLPENAAPPSNQGGVKPIAAPGTAPTPGAAPPAGAAPTAAAPGGGGRRGRGPRVPLTVQDQGGQDYSFSLEPKGDKIFALHLKKGYDKKPEYLTIKETGVKEGATWKVTDVPAPVVVVPDNALQGAPLGEIQLKPGRGGRIGASVHLTMALPKDQGVILKPVAASYTTIDNRQPGPGMISKAGESPYDARLNLPNARMARRVSFDMQTYVGVTTTETVTFHSAHIENRFGQPTLIVDKDEVVTTPSGLKVSLPAQDQGPRHQPRKIRSDITIRASYDVSGMKGDSVEGIAEGVYAVLVDPSPTSIGLSRISLGFTPVSQPDGAQVFLSAFPPDVTGTAGTFKYGPVKALTLKVTLTRPKVISTKRIVLPVNPKVFPADPGAGAPVGAQPRMV